MYYSGSYYYQYYPSVTQYLEEPEKFSGHHIEIAGNIEGFDGEFYDFRVSRYLYDGSEGETVKIKHNDEIRDAVNGFVSVYGIYNSEGYVNVINIHYHDYNNFKYIFSLLGPLILITFLFRDWKITRRGFEISK
jgi:hypothetical protein